MSFIPKLRFIVTSDIHYKVETDIEKERFEKGMEIAYRYAEKSDYKNIDAFFAVGDFANCGSEGEMLKFKESLDRCIKPETRICLMLASHEFKSGDGEEGAVKRLKTIYNQEPDNYFELNGCAFICISTEDGCSIKDKKKEWLKDCLVKASNIGFKRPFFVFQHPHLSDTVYGSINWGDDDIIAILNDYPQVIDFSGHSHAPINDPRSIHQKHFTSLGTGSFSYFELDEFDFSYGTVPPDCKECAQFYIVEADADNNVRILPVDILSGEFFNDGYLLREVWNPDNFTYGFDRALTESKPYFDDNFSFNIKTEDNIINLTFTQAKTDDYRVNSYLVVLKNSDSGKILAQKKVSSSYYRYFMPENISIDFERIEKNGNFTIEITANGFWYAKSDKKIIKFSI